MKQQVLLCIKDYRSGLDLNKDGLPFKSGAEFHAERHAQEMAKQGHAVTVFAKKQRRSMAGYEWLEGYGLHRLLPMLRGLTLIWLLLTCYRNADVMHIMGRPDFAAFAIPVAKRLGIVVSLEVTIVGEVFIPKKECKVWRKPLKALRQYCFRQCDLFIANSQEMAEDLIANEISAERIIQHAQGVDISRFCPLSESDKQTMRSRLQLPLDAPLVLFCCRVVQRKGIDLLLAAWKKQMGEVNAHLVIVGGGSADWIAQIQRTAATDPTIHYIAEVPDPVPYYQACDIYAFPSRKEGLPTSLMEAMACGLAPVVSAIGGNVDLVDAQEEVGLRCRPEDENELARQLQRLTQDANCRQRFGSAARRRIEEHFERSALVRELLSHFQEAAGRLRRRGGEAK